MFNVRYVALALASLSLVCPVRAVTFTQDFALDPVLAGWQAFGNTNLFRWDAGRQELSVTWDSTQPNSYFYHPLGFVLTRHDDFRIEFDLRLSDAVSGSEPGKTGPLQIALGFVNWGTVTNSAYGRTNPGGAPDVAEFNYFPYGFYEYDGFIWKSPAATLPAFVSGVHPTHYAPMIVSDFNNELPTNQTVHVAMVFRGASQTLTLTVSTNGVTLRALPSLTLDAAHGFQPDDEFRVDTFSISSYSGRAADFDSLLAHGVVDNLVVTAEFQPVGQITAIALPDGAWQVQFFGRANWLYTLQRTSDFETWTDISEKVPGSESQVILSDTSVPSGHAFYRVQAQSK